jgi:integrase
VKVRQRRPRDAGSVVSRRRADGSDAFMLKWKTYTRTVDVPSKGEALKLLPAFVAEAQSGDIDARRAAAKALTEQPTLTDWVAVFLDRHVSQEADRLGTRIAYASVLQRYVLPTLGAHRLNEITGPMVRDCFQDTRRKGRAVNTLKLAYAALSRAFSAAIDDGAAAVNPLPKFAKLYLGEIASASDQARRHALTRGEVLALLAACSDKPALHLWVSIMASLGLRPGEAAGLRWRDVDLDNGVVHVRGSAKQLYSGNGEASLTWVGRTKTASSVRDLAIGPTLAGLFEAERRRQEATQRMLRGGDPKVRNIASLLPDDACLFCADPATPEGLRAPRSPDTLRCQFRRAAWLAGLRDVSAHWLRHTQISHGLAGGTPLADASRRAGHKSPAVTAAIYTHAVGEGERKAALIGDGLLQAEQPLNAAEGTSDTSSDLAAG